MRYPIMISLISLLVLVSCKKQTSDSQIPACIETSINDFKNSSCETGAIVKQYSFQHKLVYSFYLGDCGADLALLIYDSDCNYLGAVGGITGETTLLNGESFSTATYLKTVWQR